MTHSSLRLLHRGIAGTAAEHSIQKSRLHGSVGTQDVAHVECFPRYVSSGHVVPLPARRRSHISSVARTEGAGRGVSRLHVLLLKPRLLSG